MIAGRLRTGHVARLGVLCAALSSVVAIEMSQTLADWWGGADSGNSVLDGPLGAVRVVRSVLEIGWLDEGMGVHIVMWFGAFVLFHLGTRRALPVRALPSVVGSLVSMGIVLEVMQGAWTLRNASIRDVVGNIVGIGLGYAVVATRLERRTLPTPDPEPLSRSVA